MALHRRNRNPKHHLSRRVVWNPHGRKKLPRYNWRRWPRPEGEAIYILKACLWCMTGDMGWDFEIDAYKCVQCGWTEWSKPRKEETC